MASVFESILNTQIGLLTSNHFACVGHGVDNLYAINDMIEASR